MIVGVLTTCHTQHTWERSMCIFLFNRTTHWVLLHTLQMLYMCTICDATNINMIIKFIPNRQVVKTLTIISNNSVYVTVSLSTAEPTVSQWKYGIMLFIYFNILYLLFVLFRVSKHQQYRKKWGLNCTKKGYFNVVHVIIFDEYVDSTWWWPLKKPKRVAINCTARHQKNAVVTDGPCFSVFSCGYHSVLFCVGITMCCFVFCVGITICWFVFCVGITMCCFVWVSQCAVLCGYHNVLFCVCITMCCCMYRLYYSTMMDE